MGATQDWKTSVDQRFPRSHGADVNIFEGSRRMAYLAGGLATAGTLIVAAIYDPYVSVHYSISHPRAAFHRMEQSCPIEAGKHHFMASSSSGQRVSVYLCLLTMPFGEEERKLIPFKVDEKGMVWGADPYSSEISAYQKELEARFELPKDDEAWVKKETSRRYWDSWIEAVKGLGIGLAIFAGFVWVVGWIVRGFLGIPQGMDRKPASEA